MKIEVPSGRYVVAVSGGVDSMVLIDLLREQKDLGLIIAHFNHGIRPDAHLDEDLVKSTAEKYHLPYEAGYGQLGSKASEEEARQARYKFLNQTKLNHKADAIITAHHQDDLIETAILNILRGTGRRGLTSIAGNTDILRPMLHLSKNDILKFAEANKLKWRDDPTNTDEKYLRNYIRRKIVPLMNEEQRSQLLKGLNQTVIVNRTIDQEIANLSQKIANNGSIDRSAFTALPSEIANEVLMHFLRQNDVRDFDKKNIDRLSVAIKTAKLGTKHDVFQGVSLKIDRANASLITTD